MIQEGADSYLPQHSVTVARGYSNSPLRALRGHLDTEDPGAMYYVGLGEEHVLQGVEVPRRRGVG